MNTTEPHTAPLPVITVPASRKTGLPLLFCDASVLTLGTDVAAAVAESPFTPVISSGPADEHSDTPRLTVPIPGWPKLPMMEDFAAGRRFVWADPDTRTLLVTRGVLTLPLDPRIGLTPVHVAAATRWVRTSAFIGLVADGATVHPAATTQEAMIS